MSSFETEIDTYDGMDIEKVHRENLEYAGVTIQREWRDNLRDVNYKNTGETINSITFEIGDDVVTIGSDNIAAAIAEFGRRPGAKAPPPGPLGEWVHEQSGMPNKGDEDFDNTVYLVGQSIAANGLPEYASGRDAFADSIRDIEKDLEKRINAEIERLES